MTVAIVCALGVGGGLAALIAALRPAPLTLRGSLAALDQSSAAMQARLVVTATPSAVVEASSHRLDRRAGRWLAGPVSQAPSLMRRLRPNLAITGATLDELCARAALAAMAGAILPPLAWGVAELGGVHTPVLVPAWASIVLAAAGAIAPALELRSLAAMARRSAIRVVGSFLDLVVLAMAGGMGVEGALEAAASIGDDPMSRRIAAALSFARDRGDTPWRALSELGRNLQIDELVELGAAVGLAGNEGARIRPTLAAKAASIRRHELARAETEANTITERLFVPGAFLLVGFLLFIGYPAFARISAGF